MKHLTGGTETIIWFPDLTTSLLSMPAGCDSVATLILTVNELTESITKDTICANETPYLWNGINYNVSGTYTHILVNAAGCDSTATLELTVNELTESSTPLTICENELPYLWNGMTLSTSGTYTYNTTNAAGCDSTATLILTINKQSASTTPVILCEDAMPYTWNGNSYTLPGTYTHTLTNAAGCDSVATLILTVNEISTSNTPVTVCAYDLPYRWNNTDYTAAGTYTANFTNAVGCDSIATLILTVTEPVAIVVPERDTLTCATTSITLDGSASSGVNATYSWSDGTNILGTANMLTVTLPGITP